MSLFFLYTHTCSLSHARMLLVSLDSDVHSEAADLLPAMLARLRSAQHIIKFRFQ